MKNEKLTRSIGNIGDDLLEEAASYKAPPASGKGAPAKRRIKLRRAALIAASLALVITLGFLIPPLFRSDPVEPVSGDDPRSGHTSETEIRPGITFDGSAYVTDAGAELPEPLKQVEILANGTAEKLIPTTSTLVVKTASECDTETLTSYITVTPELPMAVTQVTATEFHIKPAQTQFAPNTLYRVTVGDPQNPASSFAFQTVNELAVKNILPAAGATEVPVGTGIEVTFNDAVKNADFSEFISVSPAIDGSFMLYPNGKTVVFVPEKNLEYNTAYTVTVKEGVESVSGKTLSAGKTAVFRTVSGETVNGIGFDLRSTIRKSGGKISRALLTPGTPLNAGDVITYNYTVYKTPGRMTLNTATVSAEIYRAVSWEAALEAAKAIYFGSFTGGADYGAITDEYFSKVESISEQQGEIEFSPKTEGFYLAVFTAKHGDKTSVKYDTFQASPLKPGGVSSDGSTVICVCDPSGEFVPGVTLDGVRFNINDVFAGKTDGVKPFKATCGEDGAVVLENGDDDALLFIYSDGEHSALSFNAAALTDENENFIKFLYTDRRVYFSDDTVNVWGSLNGVYGARVPDELYIFTGFSSVGTPVKVNGDGTFSASFEITGAKQTYSFVRAEDRDGRVLAYTNINVTESEKPVLKAQMTFDKPYYLYDETVTATVNVTFYDGTPAEGYDVSVSCSRFKPAKETATTDKNGNAVFTVKTGYLETKSTYPQTLAVYAYISGEGTDSIHLTGFVKYFHSQYVFACEGRTLKLNWLDISKCPDYIAGESAKGTLNVDLYKSVTKVTKITEYDAFTKKKITHSRYDTTREIVKSARYEIDGTLELPAVNSDSEYVYYYYKVYMSERGNTYELTVFAGDPQQSRYYGNGMDYYRQTGLTLDKDYYGVDETVKATFISDAADGKDKLIAFFADGLVKYAAGDSAEVKFTEERLPLIQARALCYNTVYGCFETYSKDAYYDYGKYAAADMDVKTDKESYKPGDTAVITVKAPGLAGGTALVSLVDEACFALGENTADIINSYITSLGYYRNYASYYYSYFDSVLGYSNRYVSSYLSNVKSDISFGYLALVPVPNTSDGRLYRKSSSKYYLDDDVEYEAIAVNEESPGANGMEKSYYVREVFLDNPVFAVVTLNENGEGSVVCKIPDNLTTWRLTAFAVKNAEKISDIRVSQSVSDTVCTLPFFVKTDVCEKYVAGDDIALSVHCFGAKAEGNANYTAIIADSNGREIARKEVSGNVSAFTGVNFGKLEEGVYTLTVYADCGEYTDAVKSVVSVVGTMLAVDICKTVNEKELASIAPLSYPVNVVIRGDGSDTLYTQILHRLYYAGRYDDPRADTLAAKYAAVTIMQKIYGYDAGANEVAEIFKKYIEYGSGVKLLTYGEPDIELTALIADVAKEIFGTENSADNAFDAAMERNEFANDEELCAVVYGMAALGRPVLDTLYSVASYAGDFDDIAKLYLACGFAAAGDYGAALEIYSAVAKARAAEKGDGTAIYFDMGDSETTIKATSLALIAASRVKRADALKLANYLASVPNHSGESAELALAAFVKYYIPAGEQQLRTVYYTLADGERREAEIGFGRSLSLTLYKADFESFRLEGCENASISVRYSGSAAETDAYSANDGRVHVEKTIEGDHVILRIYGTSTKRWECFEINDVIPSGARYLFTDRSSWERGVNGSASVYNRSGQQISGYVYIESPQAIDYRSEKDNYEFCDEYSFSVTVRYRIRNAVKGEFVVEPAVVRSEYSGVYAISESGTLIFE